MSRSIKELNLKTVSLLKSSQVISSLSSIVKECLENSLDAGATVIAVKLDAFGFRTLEIKDNGRGINEADIAYVAKPHHTSKIQCFEDLGKLSTYGFRGEAISSLCAISDLTIRTKTSDDCVGQTCRFDYLGNILTKCPIAMNTGTTIIVNNLFKNLPVRKQFYSSIKRRRDELKKVEELIMSYALIRPKLHLSLHHDRQVILLKTPFEEREHCFYNIFQDVSQKFSFKHLESSELTIQMWLPGNIHLKDSMCGRSSNDRLFLFVNSRPVFHKTIEKLTKAYFSQQSAGSHGRYPIGMICIEVPSDSVDVNLEPNKSRVLFKDEASVLNAIETLLSELYGKPKYNIIPKSVDGEKEVDNLPCTFAEVSQEKVDEARSQNCKNMADVNKCGIGRQEKKVVTNVMSSTPNSDVKSTVYSQCSLSTINETISSASAFALASQDINSEQHFLPVNISHTSSYNDLQKVNSKINSEFFFRPTDIVHSTSFTDTQEVNNKDAHTSLIGEDGVPVYIVPNIYDGTSSVAKEGDWPMVDNVANPVVENLHENSIFKVDFDHGLDNDVLAHANDGQVGHCGNRKESNKLNYEDTSIKAILDNKDLEVSEEVITNKDVPSILAMNRGDLGNKDQPIIIGEDCWSRGHVLLENKSIQNVKILTPPTAGKETEDIILGRDQKRKLNDVNIIEKAVCKKVKNDVPKISVSFQSTPVTRRAKSAFSLFAQDTRIKVLQENPGADFTVVAQEIATRWKNADSVVKLEYEKKSKEAQQQCTKNNRFQGYVTPSAKRVSTLFKNGPTYFLDRVVAPVTPEIFKSRNESLQSNQTPTKMKPNQTRMLVVYKTFDEIKKNIQLRKNSLKNLKKECLIGCLKGINGWIYKIDNQICSFNSSRLNEIIVYQCMMGSFSVPTLDLMPPILIDANILGTTEWQTMVQLSEAQSMSCGEVLVDDKRILANGFKISLFKDNTEPITQGKIIGMIDAISNYGTQELRYILQILNKNSESILVNTRPPRLQDWLKGEAVRMAKVAPHFRDRTTVMDKIAVWKRLTNDADKNLAECLHGNLIFTPLVSLDFSCMDVT